MKTIQGNLIQLALGRKFDVIVHGCNCFNTMGAGIAKQIKEQFPAAWQTDCATVRGDIDKLGSISFVGTRGVTIVNAYTQYRYGRDPKHTDYTAIRRAFQEIARIFPGSKIAYPAIGAGLGGGDWKVISSIIDQELDGLDHTFVTFKAQPVRDNYVRC